MIGRNIDIVVTSVLQTTAGKMIFGRFIESAPAATAGAATATAGAPAVGSSPPAARVNAK
jgi:hypothetical protein